MEANVSTLSCRLYDVMEEVGASEKMRALHRSLGKIEETMQRIFLISMFDITPGIYRCGSYYEGTVTPDLRSDIDTIVRIESIQAVVHPGEAASGETLVIYFDQNTRPGYVKLTPALNDNDIEPFEGGLMPLKIDKKGNNCYQHMDIKDEIYTRNGPAFSFTTKDGDHIDDYVSAISCSQVPREVHEWLSRSRRNGWPTSDQLSDMKNLGCMVVGVGHKDSDESHLEWRLSFSLQERLLMTNLTPVQHKVYILLKMVKKDLIESTVGPFISSYHLKTCLFHAIENTPASIWRKNNTINGLTLCLKYLLRFIMNKNCPNYFWKEQNLFLTKDFKRMRGPIMKVLTGIITECPNFVLSLNSDDVGMLLKADVQSLNNFGRPALRAKKYEFGLKMHTAISCKNCINSAFNRSGPTDPEHIRRDFEKFINSERIREATGFRNRRCDSSPDSITSL